MIDADAILHAIYERADKSREPLSIYLGQAAFMRCANARDQMFFTMEWRDPNEITFHGVPVYIVKNDPEHLRVV